MKALVTGGGGFAGTYLSEALLGAGHKVISVGNTPAGANDQIQYLQLDLLEAEAIATQIDFNNLDCIFHLAGLTNVAESFKQPMKYFNTNSNIQMNLFEASLKQNAHPRFLIISSAHVYRAGLKTALQETAATMASSPYAASKLAQELLAMYYQQRGFEVVVARAFNHVGPGQGEGFLVADFAKRIAEAEAHNQPTIKVGNLKAKRDYSDVRDIVKAYIALAERATPGEVYNVCSAKPRSGKEIVSQLINLSQANIKTASDPDLMRPNDIPVMYGDNSKIMHATGWKPEISLEQTLSDTLNYWRQQIKV